MKTRILVVDDHPVFRYGLVALVESDGRHSVVAQAGSVDEALVHLEALAPDLALVDLSLGTGGTGLDLLDQIRRRFPRVLTLVVSLHNESVYGERARAAGARGYVMKQAPGTVLKEAIRAVLAGKTVFTLPSPTPRGAPVDPFALLSPREREVLGHLGRGRGVSELAGVLGLSVKTVGVYQDHLKTKLGVASNADLRRLAIEWLGSQ